MTRRSLLIGAETGGLTGVHNDVESMATVLDGHGFTIERREKMAACRAGILDAYEKLICDTGPDDAVVVYYSGHGGYIAPPAPEPSTDSTGGATGRPDPMPMQFIVPTDYDDTTEDDFRGITAVELSVLQARLTQVTQNVVVVLDCCHSAHMSRDDPDLRVKALPRPALGAYEQVRRHIGDQRAGGLRTDLRHLVGNPYAVRLVACAPRQSAYEYTNGTGVRTGMFTEALTTALEAAKSVPITWFTLVQSVRRRVLGRAPNQRPEAEGPSRRLLFDLREAEPIAALPMVPASAGRITLPGAPLLGVQVGDEFAIMAADVPLDVEASIGTARVQRVAGLAAQAELRLRRPGTTLPEGARAHRTRAAAPALAVRVAHPDPRTTDLVAAITGNPLVRLAGPDESAPFEVRIDESAGYVVCDRLGALHVPRPTGPAAVRRVVADLERLARASALRALGEDPRYLLDESLTVEWGRVVDGVAEPMGLADAVVHQGDLLYVRVRNDGDDTVYVSLVDIGVSARITHLTDFAPSGIRLPADSEYLLGYDDLDEQLRGVPVTWPAGLVPASVRPETILLIATSAPQDIGLLQQGGVRGGTVRGDQSPLEQALAQLTSGGMRDVGRASGPGARYALRTVDFGLSPLPRPQPEEAGFLIDRRPNPSVLLLSPRGTAPEQVAVRLDELVVHRNRALLGADIRVDAVVLTGDGDPTTPTYRTRTERFSNVRDGDRLPLDRMLVYHGPAVDYLDLAVWVSRDTADSLALSDLLRDQLGSQEVQAAGLQLTSLALAAPQAAAAVAAVGASAVIINVAYRLLLAAVGNSIGLYRTSLLAHEEFGVGRHPTQGRLRAQDFSFAFTIESVGRREATG
ncbi:caspase family protein [Solwaraspora sp. WMMB335]|uniref:caspase family protein n=1 Tax=Solwaraspora sp. WMMB335 TaxID=3404118 RepID=UPI003B92AB69